MSVERYIFFVFAPLDSSRVYGVILVLIWSKELSVFFPLNENMFIRWKVSLMLSDHRFFDWRFFSWRLLPDDTTDVACDAIVDIIIYVNHIRRVMVLISLDVFFVKIPKWNNFIICKRSS